MQSEEIAKEIVVALVQAKVVPTPEMAGEAYKTTLRAICEAQVSVSTWLESARAK